MGTLQLPNIKKIFTQKSIKKKVQKFHFNGYMISVPKYNNYV
jgi:hypothetical protein